MGCKRCLICEREGYFPTYHVKEMQYGIGGEFEYFKCDRCGCLQIKKVPGNIAEYYLEDYYAHTAKATGFVKLMYAALKKGEVYHYTREKREIIGRLFCILLPEFLYPVDVGEDVWDKRILDVGCGTGRSIRILREIGFKHILGVEPFIDDDVLDEKGEVLVRKADVFDIHEKFDIIVLQHSLEHMPDNYQALKHMNECLNDIGECIISIPTVSSWAWKKYGNNWFNLDAPRHLFLHSVESISLLASRAGFEVKQIKYNSNHSQITGSELYAKGLNSGGVNRRMYSLTGSPKLLINSIRSKRLDNTRKGDMITVHLCKRVNTTPK